MYIKTKQHIIRTPEINFVIKEHSRPLAGCGLTRQTSTTNKAISCFHTPLSPEQGFTELSDITETFTKLNSERDGGGAETAVGFV